MLEWLLDFVAIMLEWLLDFVEIMLELSLYSVRGGLWVSPITEKKAL